MIVRREANNLVLVTQGDHAALAARMLSLWLRDGVPKHPRRPELLVAARDHDLGWQGADAAPALDPAGRPYDLFGLPGEARLAIWHESLDRLASRGWDGVLIRELLRRGAAPGASPAPLGDDWCELEESLSRQRHQSLAALAASSGRPVATLERELDEDTALLETVDSLSLFACAAGEVVAPRRPGATRVEARFVGEAVELKPFPFAGPSTLVVSERVVPDRAYGDLCDLVETLARTRWRVRRIRFAPSEDDSPPSCAT